jgi:hypothetical protein
MNGDTRTLVHGRTNGPSGALPERVQVPIAERVAHHHDDPQCASFPVAAEKKLAGLNT